MNYERCFFFYEILILIKTKNINGCCFQVITNQTNHDYLFQWHQQYNKKKLNFFFLMTPTTIFIIEKDV